MANASLTSVEEWLRAEQAYYERLMGMAGDIISPIGIGFAILSICSLFREAFVKKNSFYVTMFIVSCLDACFCSLYLAYSACYRPIKAGGCTGEAVAWTLLVMRGTVYSVSLACDMCILTLTIERYVAVCWPQRYQTLSLGTKRWAAVAGAAVILLVSVTRYHYSIELVVVKKSAGCYSYELSPALPALVGMTMFNEMILPFVLAVGMLFFTGRITMVVLQRKRRHAVAHHTNVVWLKPDVAAVAEPSPAIGARGTSSYRLSNLGRFGKVKLGDDNGDDEAQHQDGFKRRSTNADSNSIISLTLCLDTLFTMNQLGYCVYAIGSWSEAYCQGRLDGPFCSLKLIRPRISFASILLECLARSLSFALYFVFSRTIRAEFTFMCSSVWRYTIVRPSEAISAVFDHAESGSIPIRVSELRQVT